MAVYACYVYKTYVPVLCICMYVRMYVCMYHSHLTSKGFSMVRTYLIETN